MGGKDLERIVLEVEDGDEATVTDGLQPLERQLSFLWGQAARRAASFCLLSSWSRKCCFLCFLSSWAAAARVAWLRTPIPLQQKGNAL
jgi:hypothetical protein